MVYDYHITYLTIVTSTDYLYPVMCLRTNVLMSLEMCSLCGVG
jgi:hypothetical protein